MFKQIYIENSMFCTRDAMYYGLRNYEFLAKFVIRVRVISRAALGTTLDAALAVVPAQLSGGTTLAVVKRRHNSRNDRHNSRHDC